MLKWILWGAVAIVLWYILAPLFTPRSLRGPRSQRKSPYGKSTKVIDGKGKVIK